MKQKGFTLVELIAVIVIIAIVAMITSTIVTNKIEESEKKLYEVQKNNIIEASQKYMLENKNLDKYHLNTICVYVSTLQEKGFLDQGEIIDPITKKDMAAIESENGTSIGVVKIKFNNDKNQYDYYYTESCSSNIVKPISDIILENETINVTDDKDGLYETTNEYIYKGVNPNNYVTFNNTTWRIISIDKDTMMVKIVNLNNNQVTLNGKNINNIVDDLNTSFETGSTYNSVKNYININSRWNKGIIKSLDSYSSIKSVEKQSNDYRTLGLVTIGDYLGASLNKECYKDNNCTSYLNNKSNYWLLNTYGDNEQWYITNGGKIEHVIPSNQLYNVYPTLFLKLGAQITGKGTQTDPYVIK